MHALSWLFDRSRSQFPTLGSDYFNTGGARGKTNTPCAIGSLMLVYGSARRKFPELERSEAKFGPFPRPGTAAHFIQELLACLGVEETEEWCRTLADEVMTLNDGVVKMQEFFQLPQGEKARCLLQRRLED